MTGMLAAEPQYTEQQRLAIETRDVSVALSAGAGCGKTFVLTERFLSHFDPRTPGALGASDLSRLVAITFTERAAREMRDRIRRKCHERLMTAAGEEADHWAALVRALDGARISTIHSFCGSLLRSRAVEAGVDPQFEVLEQSQAESLLSEAIDDTLRERVAAHDEPLFDLALRFGLRSLHELLRMLVVDCSAEQFAEWLKIAPEEQLARWQALFDNEVRPAIAEGLAASSAAREIVAILADHVPTNPTMRERGVALVERLATIQERSRDGNQLAADLEAIRADARVQGGGGAKAWPSAEIYERFKLSAAELRDLADKGLKLADFDASAARDSAVVGAQLLALAEAAAQRYTARKQEIGALDFNDLFWRARRLLVGNQAMRDQLSAQLRLLLVDEFQDTDPLQVELVEALCGRQLADGKLFFVGDHKQSIYRFRGADPHVFRRLRDRTPRAGRQTLSLNFRSQPAILSFVNALFWHDLGDDYEPLRASHPQVSPQPAVEFLWAVSNNGLRESVRLCREREADWIARRLRQLLDSGEPIVRDVVAAKAGRAEVRAATPGDIAILFRALSDVDLYEAALRKYGIDYYLVGGHAFYAQQEIFDLLNLLRAVASTADVVSLAGALRSSFFSLADETIFWLAQHKEGLAGGVAAGDHAAITSEQRARVRFAHATLTELRAAKDRLPTCELIELALERTGYDAVLLCEFLGERKLANLRKLVEQARAFEQGGFLGLTDYIAQLAEFVAAQPDEPLAATHSEDTNVVRLMSIHQSKGLEFPIVVVPDLDRPRHSRSPGVHFDPRLGPLVKLPHTNSAKNRGAPPPAQAGFDLWRFLEQAQDAAELNRLLYVATTRAADYLILSTGLERLDKAGGPWMELVARRFDLASGRFIGRLDSREPHPEVRVTTTEPEATRRETQRTARVDIDALLAAAEAETGAGRATAATTPHRAIDPIAPDTSARREYSFSRLTGALASRGEAAEPLAIGAASSTDPMVLGNLVHAALATIDFDRPPRNVRALVERHAPRRLPAGSADVEEAVAMIERFVRSPRARHLAAARASYAEIEFLLAWPPGAPRGEIFLGGFVDRLHQDDAGQWHILDFKTGGVSPGEVAEAAAHYEMQMFLYALAAEQILKTSPASLTLHFLRAGDEHTLAWNDAARRRVVEEVSAAIAAAERGDSA